MAVFCCFGIVGGVFGPPTKSRPYLVVFIAVRNLVGIDDDDDFIGMAANRLDYLQTK